MPASYRIFGDLRVTLDTGEEHHVSGRQAEVLAALLVAHPDGVSSDRLIDQIWGSNLPADPEATLHSSASRLRAVIGEDLAKTPSGYRVRASAVDSAEYETAVGAARATQSLEGFLTAEELWRGEPYQGFDDQTDVRTEIERLKRIRRWATRDRLELMVETGQASAAADELEAAMAMDPFDEEALSLLMRALYKSGRKPKALAAFREYESLLAEETGLEPSVHVRELEVAILTDHLDFPAGESSPRTPLDLSISYTTVADRGKIAVGRTGEGTPLLVHPGWMSKLDLLATGLDLRIPLWAELARRFEVVIFDRAGTGLSRDAPVTRELEESVEELISVMTSCFDRPIPVLAGSAAGPIVAKAAHERPEIFSHIIFHGTYASGPSTFPPEVAKSLVALVRASWGMGSDVLASLLFPSSSTEFKAEWSATQRELADGDTAAILLEQMYRADASDCLHELGLPCLVVHYRQDKAVPVWGGEQLAQGVPGAQFTVLEGQTHYPFPGEEPRVADIFTEFIEETALTEN